MGVKKPLILRGARQVGKTWLIRDPAQRHGLDLLELNFERNPEYRKHFSANTPRQVLDDLSLVLGRSIQPQRSLLLLDEIQVTGEMLGKLRWFAEESPELPVVASGSLLEFSFKNHLCAFSTWRARKSLHQFMHDKKLSLAVRCDANPPAFVPNKESPAIPAGDRRPKGPYRTITFPINNRTRRNVEFILPD
ncbi:MAG: AAA family ATPase [Fibrobacteres bacterium]|nr:AAA family ATPase [Fibrobacterota bacterium]